MIVTQGCGGFVLLVLMIVEDFLQSEMYVVVFLMIICPSIFTAGLQLGWRKLSANILMVVTLLAKPHKSADRSFCVPDMEV